MLEFVDPDKALSKEEYKTRLEPMQTRLYELEHEIFNQKIPVMIVLEGWGTSGKGKLVNLLAERMDPRGFRVVPIKPPRTSETKFPWLWRFWNKIPSNGQIVTFDTSWYQQILNERVAGHLKNKAWETALQDILEFEEMLSVSGMVILKFWLQISEDELKDRIKELSSDELTSWQITDLDLQQKKKYEKYTISLEEMLTRTDSPQAKWTVVESNDRHFSRIKVLETIISTLELKLEIVSSIDADHNVRTQGMKGAVNA